MHKIKIFFAAGLIVTGAFCACNKDLKEKVYSDVTEQNFGYTNAYQVVGIVYANMRGLFGHQAYYMIQETSSDEIVMPANASGWDDGGIYKRLHLHTWNSENPQLNQMWNALYTGVINSNRIIDQLQAGKITIPSNSSKEALVAEMKVARAFNYWLILDNYGEAPLLTTVTADLPSKTSRKEIYAFIIKEINDALPTLSEDNGKLMYGRFNKWGAKALLANIYLNAKIYAGEEKWGDCITQCNDIINSGKYALEPNFRDIFKTQNENSPESIFAIPFDENVAGGNFVEMYSWHGALKGKVNMQATPWGSGSAMGISQFIDTYDPADTRLTNTWLMGLQYSIDGVTPLKGSYDQAGKNLVFTKDLPDGLYTGEAEGYRMNKFEVKQGALSNLSNDFPFFRLAEVLLMKAECLLRTGKSAEAAQIVTQVRMRDYNNNVAKATVTGPELEQNSRYNYGYVEHYKIVDPGNKDAVQYGRLLDELGYEFAWEAHRRRDMIRFGIFTKKSWLSHKPNGDYRIAFPIPQPTINANPNLKQNPDYK